MYAFHGNQSGEICLEADNTYLKDFYDEIASHFESKLVLHLGYRGPWVLYDMVSKVLEAELSISSGEPSRLSPIGQFRIFDLGCGSGLCGRVFGHLCKAGVEWTSVACPNITIEDTMKALEANAADQALSAVSSERFVPLSLFESAIPSTGALLAGIDISANMIDVSSNPVNNYTLLTCGHLVDGLRAFCGDKDKLDLIIAADTFIYVGALEKVFKLISEALKSGGLLTFSTELLAPEIDGSHPPLAIDETYLEGELVSNSIIQHGFRLLESARFGHSVKYIQSLCKAHGLKIISAESRVLRTESSVPLPGMFYVIQKKIAMPNCS